MAVDDIDALRQFAIAVDTATGEVEDTLSVHVKVNVIVDVNVLDACLNLIRYIAEQLEYREVVV